MARHFRHYFRTLHWNWSRIGWPQESSSRQGTRCGCPQGIAHGALLIGPRRSMDAQRPARVCGQIFRLNVSGGAAQSRAGGFPITWNRIARNALFISAQFSRQNGTSHGKRPFCVSTDGEDLIWYFTWGMSLLCMYLWENQCFVDWMESRDTIVGVRFRPSLINFANLEIFNFAARRNKPSL